MMNGTREKMVTVASALLLLAGAWVALSPIWIAVSGWALAFQLVAGIGMFFAGATQMLTRSTVPSWLTGAVGAFLMLMTVLFDVSSAASLNLLITGGATFLLSVFDGYEVASLQEKAYA